MKRILAVLVLFSVTQAMAVKEFYSLSRTTRGLGMGNAYYGLSNDEGALFYNPAGLARYKGGSQVMILNTQAQFSPKAPSALNTMTKGSQSAAQLVNALSEYQGTPLYAGVSPWFPYYLQKNFAMGLLLADTKIDFAYLGKDLDSLVDVTALVDTGLFAGYAMSFMEDKLHVGLNLKGLVRAGGHKQFTVLEIAQGDSLSGNLETLGGVGGGVDFDLGGTYILPKFIDSEWIEEISASLVFNNLLASNMTSFINRGTPPGLSRLMSLGFQTTLKGYGVIDKADVVLDFAEFQLGGNSNPNFGERSGSFWKHVNLGVELPMKGWFFLRTGIHQGYLTAGFGIDVKFFKLDFATYAEELARLPGRLPSRRYVMRIALGFGGRPPGAVPSATETQVPAEEPKSEEIKPVEEAKSQETKAEPEKPKEDTGQYKKKSVPSQKTDSGSN